jgi:hypothetical protein
MKDELKKLKQLFERHSNIISGFLLLENIWQPLGKYIV